LTVTVPPFEGTLSFHISRTARGTKLLGSFVRDIIPAAYGTNLGAPAIPHEFIYGLLEIAPEFPCDLSTYTINHGSASWQNLLVGRERLRMTW
jgi:hypothetical protein